MWVHRKPNASSNRFKNLFFLVGWWGSVSLPIVILNRPILHKETYIFPPINIVEGCKDPRYKRWGIHQYFFWTVNSSTSYVGTCMYHCKKKKFTIMSESILPHRQVHFLRVCHTWIYFSKHNSEGARLSLQDLCGNSVASGVQWISYKTCC